MPVFEILLGSEPVSYTHLIYFRTCDSGYVRGKSSEACEVWSELYRNRSNNSSDWYGNSICFFYYRYSIPDGIY